MILESNRYIISIFVLLAFFGCSNSNRNVLNSEAFSVDLEKNSDAKLFGSDPPLRYPREALREKVSGFVDVVFVVNKIGKAVDIVIIREFPEGYGFGDTVVSQVKSLQFNPAVLDGKRVRQKVKRTYNFDAGKT